MNEVLVAERLSKCYRVGRRKPREVWALRGVSFTVEPGTILGIIGPNGAGKTTLLKVLSRITPPTEGRVLGRGRVVPLLALGAGFQPDLTGRENVFLNAAMYGISAADVERRMAEIIEFAGIPDFIDVPVKRYSSGMYLRLAFSVAIHMEPDILLADEVLAVGDLEFQERCLARVHEAGESGMTALFVSHDMTAITRLCHRVLWLDAGEIIKIGDPQDVVVQYQQSVWKMAARRIRRAKSGQVNRFGEILFARLTALDGREIGAARASEEALLQVGFRVAEPHVRVRLCLDVEVGGLSAFRSLCPEDVTVDSPGPYLATIRLPAHLLAETTYSVTPTIGIFHGNDYHPLVALNALTFHVYGEMEGGAARGTHRLQLRGVVAPRLEWRVAPEAECGAIARAMSSEA